LTVVEAGGEIVVQDSGGYSTGFTISQSVTIDAAGLNASVITTSFTDLCTINTPPGDRVVLRGISFHGANVGNNAINVRQVGSLYIEHCSIAEFRGDGVVMGNSNLFLTDTDVRKCLEGIFVGSGVNLVAQNSRVAECAGAAFFLFSATGWLSNCTASLCGVGFQAESDSAVNANLTLANCRAIVNNTGILVRAESTGSATVRVANCVVTNNVVGLTATQNPLGGPATVVGTSPGTNLIADNGSGNTTGNAPLALQ
jgi:hypothetical protein